MSDTLKGVHLLYFSDEPEDFGLGVWNTKTEEWNKVGAEGWNAADPVYVGRAVPLNEWISVEGKGEAKMSNEPLKLKDEKLELQPQRVSKEDLDKLNLYDSRSNKVLSEMNAGKVRLSLLQEAKNNLMRALALSLDLLDGAEIDRKTGEVSYPTDGGESRS